MAFDGTNFREQDAPRKGPTRGENVLTTLIVVLALALLVLPVSAAGLRDIAIYLGGR